MLDTNTKPTTLSKGSGCGCKIAPAVLEAILKDVKNEGIFPSLVAGFETKDDAAAWRLDNGMLLLSTTDFFTPIVDDPFDFARVAATNALSDIYAMGGKPIFSLAVLGFPVEKYENSVVTQILNGASEVCKAAGIPIAGGHSINIPEPVFGLVVNGMVEEKYLKKNSTAKSGDLLFLTKSIGTGIVSAASKRGKANEEHVKASIESMCTLNKAGAELAKISGVNAMTDITGFGLLGHIIEMCEGSGLSAEIDFKNVQLLPGVPEYAAQFIFPDNTPRIWNAAEKKTTGIAGPSFISLCDPQTSGGILISVSENGVEEVKKFFKANGLEKYLLPIGRMMQKGEFAVKVIE
ncbi:MAG: selenide, water dikinase SelD [Bacteroidetes bacterium]|nr:selenide, water dikinase SelD [Bacteroidota bacterium]